MSKLIKSSGASFVCVVLFIVLLSFASSFVFAANTPFMIGFSDTGTASDIILGNEISTRLYSSGIISSQASAASGTVKLFSMITSNDIEENVALLIYKGEIVIVVGEDASSSAEDFAEEISSEIYSFKKIKTKRIVSSSEVDEKNLEALFDYVPENDTNTDREESEERSTVIAKNTDKKTIYYSCNDSDGGSNIFVAGTTKYTDAIRGSRTFSDFCEGKSIHEYSCVDNYYYEETAVCLEECQEGRCLDASVEFDTSKMFSSTGCEEKHCTNITSQCSDNLLFTVMECTIYINRKGTCNPINISEMVINENACSETKLNCTGCRYGENLCTPIGARFVINNIESRCGLEGIWAQSLNEIPCSHNYECISNNCNSSGFCDSICEGCLNSQNICVPLAAKTNEKFCGKSGKLENLKEKRELCSNDYECFSDSCKDGKCRGQGVASLLRKLFK